MEPSARIIDAQSVRAAASVRAASRGYDGGKKVPGRKRHIITYILGLLLVVAVTAANFGDRDAAAPLLQRLRWLPREITLIWADGGCGGLINWAKEKIALTNPSMSSVRLTTSAHIRMADALAPSGP
ncbi:transposase [Streptomyces sp. KS 21]|uniref:transposase n=1 Tax=Streptomyces sp. KS 21 TaxID=2485150 RepID=UPI001FB8DD55|nr:transposase [Streptomyces sp. KS 21]